MDMGDEETLLSVSNNDLDDRGVGVQVSQTQHTLLHLLRLRMGEKLDTHTGNVCSLDENSIKSGEFSEDLYQRSHQDTRWAKVDMSAMHAFFRNIPTIYTCMGRDADAFGIKNNMRVQKQLLKKRKNPGIQCFGFPCWPFPNL